MSTQNITVLFTDLVGSTALQSSVDPAAADTLRRDHFTLLRQAITDAGGREVKNLGDGLMVVFTTASAAIGRAVAMQQGVELQGRSGGPAAGLRVLCNDVSKVGHWGTGNLHTTVASEDDIAAVLPLISQALRYRARSPRFGREAMPGPLAVSDVASRRCRRWKPAARAATSTRRPASSAANADCRSILTLVLVLVLVRP